MFRFDFTGLLISPDARIVLLVNIVTGAMRVEKLLKSSGQVCKRIHYTLLKRPKRLFLMYCPRWRSAIQKLYFPHIFCKPTIREAEGISFHRIHTEFTWMTVRCRMEWHYIYCAFWYFDSGFYQDIWEVTDQHYLSCQNRETCFGVCSKLGILTLTEMVISHRCSCNTLVEWKPELLSREINCLIEWFLQVA